MKAGNNHNRKPTYLEELFNRYELSNSSEGKKPKTIGWYTDMLRLFLRFLKKKNLLEDISSFNIDNIRAYIVYLQHKPRFQGHPYTPQQSSTLSSKTLQCHARVLKAFSSWLYREGYTRENRLKILKLPKAEKKVMEPLTNQEKKQIISSIDMNSPTGKRNHAIFAMSIDTGLRASGLAGINLRHLNLIDGFVKVMEKGSKERIVPIGKKVCIILGAYIGNLRPEPADPNNNALFLTRNGKPITANTLKLLFSRLAKKSGVKRLHCHLCRHTFAIDYLLNGGDIYSLKAILGHSTLDMVNEYLHFTSQQITDLHHKFSPMDKFFEENQQG
jgi:site-specific recombinase XerD